MGTNYYLVKKKEYDDEKEFRNILRTQIESNDEDNSFHDLIKETIMKRYEPLIKRLKEEKYDDVIIKFEDKLNDELETLMSNLKYSIDYVFDVSDKHSKHIGKSSLGWLFNFQYQEEWSSYDQFKNFITSPEKMKGLTIVDEYGEGITPEKLLDLIDTKQNDQRNLDNPDNFTYNDNVEGYRFTKNDFS